MCKDTARNSQTRCSYPGCDRTVWKDPDGSFSSYCGKGHRDAMARISPNKSVCQNCQARPVYVENGRAHSFCGQRCGKAFKNGEQNPASPRKQPTPQTNGHCALRNCNLPAYVNRNGERGQYCSQRHRQLAVEYGLAEACLFCEDMPKATINGELSDFCSRKCGRDATDHAPLILRVPSTNQAFHNVANQFRTSWKHPTPVPTIERVWKIYGTRALNDTHSRYRLAVERRTGLPDGNTCRRWHGTIRNCNLGDNDQNRDLCTSQGCSLCQIIKSSFQLIKQGQRTNFGRFGKGIYTSATSSKANDYVASNRTLTKAVLLNSVTLGKTVKLTVTDQTLIKPPGNADAVIGEPGGDLNYDESIVYDNDAIRPLYLVIYKH